MHFQAVGTQNFAGFPLQPGASAGDCSFTCTSAGYFEVVGILNQTILFLHDIITGGGDTQT